MLKKLFILLIALLVFFGVILFQKLIKETPEVSKKTYLLTLNYSDYAHIVGSYLGEFNDFIAKGDYQELEGYVHGFAKYYFITNDLETNNQIDDVYKKYYNKQIAEMIRKDNIQLKQYIGELDGLAYYSSNASKVSPDDWDWMQEKNKVLSEELDGSGELDLFHIESNYVYLSSKYDNDKIEKFLNNIHGQLTDLENKIKDVDSDIKS